MINVLYNLSQNLSGMQIFAIALAYLLAIAIAITFHEFAHGYVAYKFGDTTAKAQGRLSLNPSKHISGVGFLMFLFFGFGWAKPVNINPMRFRNYKKGMIWVSLAGIITNFILAILASLLLVLFTLLVPADYTNMFLYFLEYFLFLSVLLNVSLAVFNLLPIYPLDGFNFVSVFLKPNNKFVVFMHAYGMIVLLVFILTPIFDILFSVIIGGLVNLFIYLPALLM